MRADHEWPIIFEELSAIEKVGELGLFCELAVIDGEVFFCRNGSDLGAFWGDKSDAIPLATEPAALGESSHFLPPPTVGCFSVNEKRLYH